MSDPGTPVLGLDQHSPYGVVACQPPTGVYSCMGNGDLWTVLVQPKIWLRLASGAFAGALPMLLYHFTNRAALTTFVSANTNYHTYAEFSAVLLYRIQMISQMLFSDQEHRAIWMAEVDFTRGERFYWLIAVVAAAWCVARRPANTESTRWTRSIGIALIVLLGICLTTQLPIAQHHLVVLVPFMEVCLVVSFVDLSRLGRSGAIVAITLGILYVGAACGFDAQAAIAIHRNRGLNMWSDGIDFANEFLQTNDKHTPLNVLDWGLQANLFVLSQAELIDPELFGGADSKRSDRDLTWAQEVPKGGRFLTTAAQDRVFPAATLGFEKALRDTNAPFRLQTFRQRNGRPYALLYTGKKN